MGHSTAYDRWVEVSGQILDDAADGDIRLLEVIRDASAAMAELNGRIAQLEQEKIAQVEREKDLYSDSPTGT